MKWGFSRGIKIKTHLKINLLGEQAHEKARTYGRSQPSHTGIKHNTSGQIQSEIKKHLKEMERIDQLVGEII